MTGTGSSNAAWTSGDPTQPGPATVSGDITALNPADGLFLRAEHLRTIETYARSLALALGIGVGTGVVYGFELSLASGPARLEVLPGLAVSAVGQPLRATSPLTVSLDIAGLDPVGPDGFWVVEVAPAWWAFGDDKVFGNLCDDPCGGAGSIRPWIAEGVTVRLRADALAGLDQVGAVRRRAWLASAYFERERSQGEPWLTPADGPAAVPPLWTRDWSSGGGQPHQSTVPIGVAQLVDGAWVVDTWTARRDLGGEGPADRLWRSRLAMRPWNVFIAQVLQFQDSYLPMLAAEPDLAKHEVVDERDRSTDDFINRMKKTPVANWSDFKDFVHNYTSAAAPYVLASDELSLLARGYDELPPAGFLGLRGKAADTPARLVKLFGDRIDLRTCHARADAIATAVEEARDLDRIPLASDLVEQVGVDILVPDEPADLPGTSTDDYGWVAFVRRRVLTCGTAPTAPATEGVPVYAYFVTEWNDEAPQVLRRELQSGKLGDVASLWGTLEYPAGTWEYPGGEIADKGSAVPVLGVIGLAGATDRVPLTALRAHLFAASFARQLDPLPEVTLDASAAPSDVIVVVVQIQIG